MPQIPNGVWCLWERSNYSSRHPILGLIDGIFFVRLGREVRVESPWSYSSKLEFPTPPYMAFPREQWEGGKRPSHAGYSHRMWGWPDSSRQPWGEERRAERSDRPVWEGVKSTWSGGLWRLIISWKRGKSSYCWAVAAEVFGRFSGSRWRLCTCLQL